MFGLDDWIAGFSDGSTTLLVVVAAVLLGLRHASDPDHLAAVTALIASGRENASRQRGAARRSVGPRPRGHAVRVRRADRALDAYLPETLQNGLRPWSASSSSRSPSGCSSAGAAAPLRHTLTMAYGTRTQAGGSTPAHPDAVAGLRSRSRARHGRQRGRRRAAARERGEPRARDRGARAAGALHRGLDDDALERVGLTLSRPAVQRSFARVAPVIGLASLAFGVWYALGALGGAAVRLLESGAVGIAELTRQRRRRPAGRRARERS